MAIHVSDKQLGIVLCRMLGIEPGITRKIGLHIYPGDVTEVTLTIMASPAMLQEALKSIEAVKDETVQMPRINRNLGDAPTEIIR